MFDAVRNNKRIVQVFLILITLPFALWGVDSYVRDAGQANHAAQVGDSRIAQQEFEASLREQQDRIRASLGRQVDSSMFDTPDFRKGVLDGMVHQRLLVLRASEDHLTVADDDLRNVISGVQAFQDGGKFSSQRYEAILRNQGMSQRAFEARLKQDLMLRQITAAVGDGALASSTVADRWLAMVMEERTVEEALIASASYTLRAEPSAEAIAKYYEANQARFRIPEQARAEYVVLSQDAFAGQVQVSDAEMASWYQGHKDRYQQPEERRASHILLPVPKDATEAQVKAATEKAEQIVVQLRAEPGRFAELAKEHSQDPGSAANGGDLGYFGRGAMVKPFEDAVFALREGEISGLVRSDFGIHVIRLTGIRREKLRALDEVRGEIAAEIRNQTAARKFAEAAEAFSNLVYEQADSLQPAAQKFSLEIRQSGWITRGQKTGLGPLGNDKLLDALFSDDVVKGRHNSEAVEVGNNTLVSARILEHKDAALRPLDEVSKEIRDALVAEEAAKMASREGEATLERLRKGDKVDLAWGAPKPVSRQGAAGVPSPAVRPIFATSVKELPAYGGVALPGRGYALYRITAVRQPEVKGAGTGEGLRAQYARAVADEEFSAYLGALRNRYPVTVNPAVLEGGRSR
ncbi:MAG: SurA N-terminal domain-containing protein [Betaproteobacteria bacterium]|nr:SurA N-terminal domain-containing protein [Betaproteobacteria bacterium]